MVRPNGLRVSGERRAEGDERVRCTRVLGHPFSRSDSFPKPPTGNTCNAEHQSLRDSRSMRRTAVQQPDTEKPHQRKYQKANNPQGALSALGHASQEEARDQTAYSPRKAKYDWHHRLGIIRANALERTREQTDNRDVDRGPNPGGDANCSKDKKHGSEFRHLLDRHAIRWPNGLRVSGE